MQLLQGTYMFNLLHCVKCDVFYSLNYFEIVQKHEDFSKHRFSRDLLYMYVKKQHGYSLLQEIFQYISMDINLILLFTLVYVFNFSPKIHQTGCMTRGTAIACVHNWFRSYSNAALYLFLQVWLFYSYNIDNTEHTHNIICGRITFKNK